MFRRLIPRNNLFFDFFTQHAAFIVQAARELLKLGMPANNPQFVMQQIISFEHEGDSVTHLCLDALHRTFITPFDRSDIHHLISKMDDILDDIEEVARFMILYKLDSFNADAEKLVRILIESVEEVEGAVKELHQMKNTEAIRAHFNRVNHLESEADLALMKALGRLFEEEKDALLIIKWKEVYEDLERATDSCEDVVNILEGIILENE